MPNPTSSGGGRMGGSQRGEQILVHAARLFENRPYADVMLGVAAAAGVVRSLINHYMRHANTVAAERMIELTRLDEAHTAGPELVALVVALAGSRGRPAGSGCSTVRSTGAPSRCCSARRCSPSSETSRPYFAPRSGATHLLPRIHAQ